MTNEIKNGFYFDNDGDLKYTSVNGIHYELLEGVGIGKRIPAPTSDIVFILVDEPDFDGELDTRLVGFMYGATFLLDENEERRNEWRGYVREYVEEFEEDHDNWIKEVKKERK